MMVDNIFITKPVKKVIRLDVNFEINEKYFFIIEN